MRGKRAAGKSRSLSSRLATKKKGKARKQKPAHAVRASSTTVLLVNIIPKSLSGETHQDSEPTIAVNGVVYQRNANWSTNTLLRVDNVTPVRVSIDPFFFKLTG